MTRVCKFGFSLLLASGLLCGGAAQGDQGAVPSGIAAYAILYGYEMTPEQVAAYQAATPETSMETAIFSVRHMEIAYDGAVLLSSVNLVAKHPDDFFMPDLAYPDEHADYPGNEGEPFTWRQAAEESGRQVVKVAMYPAWLDEAEAYFVEDWLEPDGSLTLVYGTYMVERGITIRTGWRMKAQKVMAGSGPVTLLDETTTAAKVPLLAPMTHIPCAVLTSSAPLSSGILLKTFFGYTPALLEAGELVLLTADGAYAPSLADVSYLPTLPDLVKMICILPDGTEKQLTVIPGF